MQTVDENMLYKTMKKYFFTSLQFFVDGDRASMISVDALTI